MYADSNSWINDRSPFENMFDSVGFTYVLLFPKKKIVLKYQDSTTEKFFENARRNLFVGGVGDKQLSTKIGSGPNMQDSPNLYFMFFDRYEIHIQAFVHFTNGQ